MLVVRAQNQASGALRRVAGDVQRLGRIRDLHYKQNQLAINQSTMMRQRQTALNNLQSIEQAQGARNLSLQRRRITNSAQELNAISQLERAQERYARSARRGVSGVPMVRLARDVEMYTQRLSAARKGSEQLGATQQDLARRASVLRSEISTVNQRLAQNAFQQREIAKAITQQRWDKVQMGGRIMTHVGRVMQLGGLVAGGALAYMASGAAKFNSEATLVATQTGPVGSGFKVIAHNATILQNSLLKLMGQTTATREELTQSAYDIYSSLSVNLGQGMKLLKLFGQASIAGMTPLNDVTAAGIHVMNAFRIPVRQMPAIMQRMFAAVRFGRMTFQQFVATLAQTSPAMSAAGQSFDDLAGATAFLTRMIPNTRMAGTALARLTEILGRGKFVQGVKEFGVNITDTHGRLLPMIDVIDKLVQRFPRLRQGGTFLQNFFKQMSGTQGTIQARRAFTFMVLRLREYHKINNQVISDNNEFNRSLQAMEQTTGVRWSKFVNQLKALALGIGTAVIPVLMEMTKPLQNLVKWFQSLDDSTKNQIGRWAAYAAAFLLVGGTIISVSGMVVTFIATLGKLGIAGAGLGVVLFAMVAAVKVLRGEWRSLSDVVTSFADTMTGSFTGFVAMSALAVAAVLRLRRALLGLAVAQAASAGTAGGAGLLAGLIGTGRGVGGAATTGRLQAMYAAEAGAGRFRAAMVGAGAAAAALPGPLKIAAAVIGLGAGAAALWELHMRGARDRAKEAARYQIILQRTTARPVVEARRFGGIGQSVRDMLEQKNALASLNAEIKQQRQVVQQANAAQKPEQQRQLNALIYQRANALDTLDTMQQRSNKQFDSFSRALISQREITRQIAGDEQRLAGLRKLQMLQQLFWVTDLSKKQRETMKNLQDSLHITDPTQLKRAIAGTRAEIDKFAVSAAKGATAIRGNFLRTIQSLQRTGVIAPRIRPEAINAALQVALRRGRALTIPEIKTVIRASVSKADLAKAPRDIQRAIREQRAIIRIQPKIARVGRAIASIFGGKITQQKIHVTSDADKTYGHMAKVFAKTIPGHVKVQVNPTYAEAFALGVQMAQGIKAGAGQVNIDIYEHIHKDIVTTQRKIEAHSPSKLTARLIGVPLMQGIIAGIEMEYGHLEKVSALAIDIFNGPWLRSEKFQNRTEASAKAIARLENRIHHLKKAAKGVTPEIVKLERRLIELRKGSQKAATAADLIKDMRLTLREFIRFNAAMERLQRRGVPLLLLDQLSQLGAEGAKMIAKLAGMTARQLRRYVRLWERAMKQVARSQRTPLEQIATDLPQKTEDAAHFLLDRWNQFHDQLTAIFGGIGETFISTWTEASDNAKQALDDLNQLVQTQFGDLFQGAYLQSQEFQTKLEWGHILNISDLMKDLQSQITAFDQWASDIGKLSARVPSELVEYLKTLGPEGAAAIHALATSSDAALRDYVSLWQNAQGKIKQTVTNFGKFGVGVTPTGALQGQISRLNRFTDVISTLEGKNIPFSILQEIVSMGPDALPFAEALASMSDTDFGNYVQMWNDYQKKLKDLTDTFMTEQVNEWRKHGSDIAAGIIAGVMDEQEELLKFFRNLFKDLLKEAKKETRSRSPSKVFEALGVDIVAGLNQGLLSGAGMRVPMPTLGGAWLRGNGYSRDDGQTINMNVTAHHDESLMTTLERASFRLRNRPIP